MKISQFSTVGRAALLAVLLLLAGCNWPWSPAVDKVQQALDDAIAQLTQTSTSWQSTLLTLEDKLRADGSDLVAQVDELLKTSIQAAGVEGRCSTDFVGQRAHDALVNIKNALLKKPLLAASPHVCATDPFGDLQLKQVSNGQVHQLVLDGYDMVLASGLGLAVQNADGQTTPIDPRFIANPSPYEIVLNLASNGYQIPGGTQKIIFTFNSVPIGDMNVEAIPPPPPPPPPVLVGPIAITFRTGNDDKDQDSYLTVSIDKSDGTQLVGWAAPAARYLENRTQGPYVIQQTPVDKRDLVNSILQICIAPVGDDTWDLGYTVTAPVSDGSAFTIADSGQQLTQDHRCLSKNVLKTSP